MPCGKIRRTSVQANQESVKLSAAFPYKERMVQLEAVWHAEP